jgi:hypothetical protein
VAVVTAQQTLGNFGDFLGFGLVQFEFNVKPNVVKYFLLELLAVVTCR